MTTTASSIPADATITIHVPGGQDQTVLWADVVTDLLAESVAASRLVLPSTNEPLTPTLAFGDGDSGLYEISDDVLGISLGAALFWTVNLAAFSGSVGGTLLNEAPTATNPSVVPILADPDTGVGSAGADILSLIAGGVEGLRFIEATGILQVPQADVGLTADVGSAQGNGLILSSYNVYSVVGSAGDAATLPEIFPVNTLIYIKNDDAAEAMDVFPFLGADLGAGTNTPLSLLAGEFVVFLATIADDAWTQLIAGTEL